MKDFADRMKEITSTLNNNSSSSSTATDSQQAAADSGDGASLAEKEALCDELMEIVENVDYARGEADRRQEGRRRGEGVATGGCYAMHMACDQGIGCR